MFVKEIKYYGIDFCACEWKPDIKYYDGKRASRRCNIPLVSIGFTSVEGAPESNVHETHYGEECFMM